MTLTLYDSFVEIRFKHIAHMQKEKESCSHTYFSSARDPSKLHTAHNTSNENETKKQSSKKKSLDAFYFHFLVVLPGYDQRHAIRIVRLSFLFWKRKKKERKKSLCQKMAKNPPNRKPRVPIS